MDLERRMLRPILLFLFYKSKTELESRKQETKNQNQKTKNPQYKTYCGRLLHRKK